MTSEAKKEQKAIRRLMDAVRFAEKNYPLPRCVHGNALKDHAGDTLGPSCGCRETAKELGRGEHGNNEG